MTIPHPGASSTGSLRARAQARLTEWQVNPSQTITDGPSAALRVLYDLAVSPDTAADALALLHELQVHQVELELQAEELRASRNDLESALARQIEIYDGLPVSVLTIDRELRLHEVNLTGAQRLMTDRESLLGQRLHEFVAPASMPALQSLLSRTDDGAHQPTCELTLLTGLLPPATVRATAKADPAGFRYLLVLTDLPSPAGP